RRHTRSKRDWSSDVCSSDLDQKSTTTELLEERGTSNPPAMLLAAAQGSLAGYCNVEGDDASLGDAMDAFSKTLDDIGATTGPERSEERRVGEEGRSRWGR